MLCYQQRHAGVRFAPPIILEVNAYFAIPKSYPKKKAALCSQNILRPTCKPDMDNIVKAVADALNGVAYRDDSAGTSEKSMNEGFYLPKETIEKLWGDMDLTASLTLSVPEYEKVGKSVESKLNNILSRHPDLVMETLQEVKASSANTIHNTSVQVYGVSAFVIMFSIFNLTNTLISRISTRRKEFGILESIGMTKKQIKKMLLHESVLLIIPCLIITVVAGTLMGYLLVRILSANGLTYFQYTFPFIPLLIYGVCLIITPIIISAICLKIQCRNSLVERIKMAD